jgi:hypothetical protein
MLPYSIRLTEINFTVGEEVSGAILQHVRDLRCFLAQYFRTPSNGNSWVRNFFVISARPFGFNVHDYERIIDIVSD